MISFGYFRVKNMFFILWRPDFSHFAQFNTTFWANTGSRTSLLYDWMKRNLTKPNNIYVCIVNLECVTVHFIILGVLAPVLLFFSFNLDKKSRYEINENRRNILVLMLNQKRSDDRISCVCHPFLLLAVSIETIQIQHTFGIRPVVHCFWRHQLQKRRQSRRFVPARFTSRR